MQKKCLSCLLVLLVLTASLFSFFSAVYSDGESWLTGWSYRKSHIMEQADDSGTNYQVKIVVDFGSGLDSGGMVYLDGKCETDFGDIRFTDNDGDIELDYWLESKTDSDNAVFWVEVADDLNAGDVVIYIYYGNDAVSTTSNGMDTFLLFDDFANLDAWSILDGSWSISFGRAYQSGSDVNSRIYQIFQHSDVAISMYAINTENGDVGVYARSDGDTVSWDMYASNWHPIIANTGILKFISGSKTVLDLFSSTITNSWQIFSMRMYNDELFAYRDDSLDGEATDNYKAGDDYIFLKFKGIGYIDWVFVRKYVDPEPVHGVWGEEEAPPTISVTFYLNDGGKFYVNATDMENSTSTEYENETVLVLMAVPANFSYIFVSFNWTASSSISNPHEYTVLGSDTIWLLFDGAGAEDEDYTDPADLAVILLVCLIFIPIILLILFVVWKKK